MAAEGVRPGPPPLAVAGMINTRAGRTAARLGARARRCGGEWEVERCLTPPAAARETWVGLLRLRLSASGKRVPLPVAAAGPQFSLNPT